MHLVDRNTGEAGPRARHAAAVAAAAVAAAAITPDYRDLLVGRVLPGRGRLAGLLDALDEALGAGAVTRRELERIVVAAEGRRR